MTERWNRSVVITCSPANIADCTKNLSHLWRWGECFERRIRMMSSWWEDVFSRVCWWWWFKHASSLARLPITLKGQLARAARQPKHEKKRQGDREDDKWSQEEHSVLCDLTDQQDDTICSLWVRVSRLNGFPWAHGKSKSYRSIDCTSFFLARGNRRLVLPFFS